MIQELATEFYQAYKEKKHVDLLSSRNIEIDELTAYKIQDQVTKLKMEENGEEIIGYKISMTSEEMQRLGKANSPAYGTFTTKSVIESSIKLDSAFPFLLEPELVFVVTEDLTVGADKNEILQKSKIAAGLEIPGSRYPNWFPPSKDAQLGDTIADNTFAGFILMGSSVEITDSIDWKQIKATLYLNDEKLDEGYSSEVLGNPLNAISWLTEKLAEENKSLKKGMIVSSGTFTSPKALKQGAYKVVFDIVGELTLTVK